jgi:urease accessory protein
MPRVAHGRLSFERAGAATVLRSVYAESPLRLLTPRNHGDAAWAYTSTLGGGLVDGDRVRLRVTVGASARAFVGTQGPTRVYRSPGGCDSEIAAEVGDGATLVLAPDPTACFAGARFAQRTAIDLAEGASLALWEVLGAGRTARGERWAFDRCSVALAVRQRGQALLDECWLLDPAHGNVSDRLGRFEAIGTVFLAGPLFAAARATLRARTDGSPVTSRAPVVESVSPLGADALLLRLAAASVEELAVALRARLCMLPALLGDDPWARRN